MADSDAVDSKKAKTSDAASEPLASIPVPERPPVLDYGHAGDTRTICARSTLRALDVSLVCHLLVFGLYAATLDGGILMRKCATVSSGYLAVAAVVFVRRRWNPTIPDLVFLALGYPAMLIVCRLFGVVD
jgi:hypothetical protein